MRLLFSVFMCLCVGSLLALLVRRGADPEGPAMVARMLVSTVFFQVGVIFFVGRFLREHHLGWASGFGLPRAPGKAIAWGGLATVIFLPLGWSLQTLSLHVMERLGIEPSVQLALQALKNSGSVGEIAAMAVVAVVLAPIAEELLFRGVLYPVVKHFGFPRLALWGTSALFAAIHFNVGIFIPLLAFALVLVWLYERTDNLLAPIAAHVAFNAINFVMFFVIEDFARNVPTAP